MTWKLNRWYEKVVYVIGWITIVLFILGFLAGFIGAIVRDNNQNTTNTSSYQGN